MGDIYLIEVEVKASVKDFVDVKKNLITNRCSQNKKRTSKRCLL